jgi:SHR-binding domain of vacuolar-sorting associated protein 13
LLTQKVDDIGNTSNGWESSPNATDFSVNRIFNPSHRFRRRRWVRSRIGLPHGSHVDGVNAYYYPVQRSTLLRRDGKFEKAGVRVAMQIDGGRWTVTPNLPVDGTVFGAIRVSKDRWPGSVHDLKDNDSTIPATTIFELCYAIQPLDGDWGLLSRSMIVTSRFLLRNDSSKLNFEIKQAGTNDVTSVVISPGQTASFHWTDFRLPELVSIRPLVKYQGRNIYRWSGGFDPLTIGPVPLRIRKTKEVAVTTRGFDQDQYRIRSIKLEAEIRPRTGGTGITLSFFEEDEKGDIALYRIENWSTFPIWYNQDGLLSNPSHEREESEREGDLIRPSERAVFSLDVPFRQGKYSHRRAATMNELLRVRIALAPLSSRGGIETMKVVSLTAASERVRLNPTKLQVLTGDLRSSLEAVRVVGTINNDGPTRVLRFR